MAQRQPMGPDSWSGWTYFASIMMLLAGGMQAIAGLVALFKDQYYLVTQNGLVAFNFTTWGWIHLAIGVLVFCAGLAVLAGSTWGRFVGVFFAVLSALANLAFLAAYPLWSIMVIIVDVLVIYGLTMHGTEAE